MAGNGARMGLARGMLGIVWTLGVVCGGGGAAVDGTGAGVADAECGAGDDDASGDDE